MSLPGRCRFIFELLINIFFSSLLLALGTRFGNRRSSSVRWCAHMYHLMNSNRVPYHLMYIRLERCVCRNRRHSLWHIPTHEQHGCSTRLPLAMVHCLPYHCILVFHGHLVVSKMTAPSYSLVISCYFLFFFNTSPFSQFQQTHLSMPKKSAANQELLGNTAKYKIKVNGSSHRSLMLVP